MNTFKLTRSLALGANVSNSARGKMFALSFIQALQCNSNKCPTGITTQNPALVRGLVVEDKIPRVQRFHQKTIENLLEMLAAMGLKNPTDVRPEHIYRRTWEQRGKRSEERRVGTDG